MAFCRPMVQIKTVTRRREALLGLVGAAASCAIEERVNPAGDVSLPVSELPEVVLPSRIGFGSCCDPMLPMPALDVAAALEPDIYLWLGDNIYADTRDPEVMRAKYRQLAAAPEVLRLYNQAHFLATWDDHDFGENDAGRDYPMRATSRELFLTFWREPFDSPRWQHDGIYTAHHYEEGGRALQILLLDTRYNRDPLLSNDGSGLNDYIPHTDARTMLGAAQWAWLEDELRKPADLRIVGSSTQLGHSYNGYESWTLFPSERERFVELVRATEAEGVLVVSGDAHWAEVSRLPVDDGYDLYDVTSSGINQSWPFITNNDNRVGSAIADNNVGLIAIDWDARTLAVTVHDASGRPRVELPLAFADLTP